MTRFAMIPDEHFLAPDGTPLAVVGVQQGGRAVERVIVVNLGEGGEIKLPKVTTCYHRVALVPRHLKGVSEFSGDLCRLCVFEVASLAGDSR